MKKINIFAMMAVISIFLGLISFIMFMVFFIPLIQQSSSQYPGEIYVDGLLGIFSILIFGISALISFVISVLILSTEFENKVINESKVLWGLLSMFALGPIGIIIFAVISSKNLNKDETNPREENISSDRGQVSIKNIETISRAFKMFEEGSITKEEFDKIKENNL